MKADKRAPSSPVSRSAAWTQAALLAAGVLVHAWLGWGAIRAQSPTFDEPLHLAAGYAYWKTGDYRLNGMHHPPLSSLVAAAPLLFLKPDLPVDHPYWLKPQWDNPQNQYGFAHLFLYHNRAGWSADQLMNAGRAAVLVASCLFLLALFRAGRTFLGARAAYAAFFMAVFSPTLLAHATLVTTDFLFAVFYFLFFCCWGKWETSSQTGEGASRRAAWAWAALSGASLAACFSGKFSAVAVVPVLGLWLLRRRFRLPFDGRSWLFFVGGFFLALAAIYQGTGLPLFFSGLRYTLQRVQGGRGGFLMGEHFTEGRWYYFPATFLLKTPLPVLAGLAGALWLAFRRRLRLPWFLVLPPLVYFLLACASSVNIGHRHILPVYPFLFLTLGAAAQTLWDRRWPRVLVAALGLALAASSLRARPFFLAYFHEGVGGRDKGYRYLVDSNADWGQGLRALRDYLDRAGVKNIYLSYFGTAEPNAHGISYAAVAPITLPHFPDRDVDLRREPRALLVVAATNLQAAYFVDKDIFGWLKDRRPEAVVAGSLLVFDVTHDAESHQRLAGLFEAMGKTEMARRERAWAEESLKKDDGGGP